MHTCVMKTKLIYATEKTYQDLLSLFFCQSNGYIELKGKAFDLNGKRKRLDDSDANFGYFYLWFDCLAICKKINITDNSDIQLIKDEVNLFLKPANITLESGVFTCERLDYCQNIVVEDARLREIYLSLFVGLPYKSGYLLRDNVYYESVYYKNKSRRCQVYDKEAERRNKHERIAPYEKGCIRFEYQLNKNYLNYKAKKKGWNTSFKSMFNLAQEEKMMMELASYFIPADFHSLAEAIDIISKSTYSEITKKHLIKYITAIADNEYGMNGVDYVCPLTKSSYHKLLAAINVHPMTISDDLGIKNLFNPARLLIQS